MHSKTLWLSVGIIASFLLAGLFLSGTKKQAAPKRNITPTAITSPTPNSPNQEVKEITVQGSEYVFLPSKITIKKGEKVRLIFKNVGTLPHNLVIAQLGLSTKTIGPRESDRLEFSVEKGVTVTFYCSQPNHRSLGMEGSLEVR